jgi:hypothetical protein
MPLHLNDACLGGRIMKKRLIVFCDGTYSRADQPAVTNVCKLREAVDESEDAAVNS